MPQSSNNDQPDTRKTYFRKNRTLVYSVAAVIVCFVVVALFYVMGMWNNYRFETAEHAAAYGDSFGFVNALFSGLALGGVVLALFVQVLEFHLAEEERTDGIKKQKQIANQQKYIAEQTKVSARAQMMDSLLALHQRSRLEIYLEESAYHAVRNEKIRHLEFEFQNAVNEQKLASHLRRALELTKPAQEAIRTIKIDMAESHVQKVGAFRWSDTELKTLVRALEVSDGTKNAEKTKSIARSIPAMRSAQCDLRQLIKDIFADVRDEHSAERYLEGLDFLNELLDGDCNGFNDNAVNKLLTDLGSSAGVAIAGMLQAYDLLEVRVIFIQEESDTNEPLFFKT